VTRRRGGGRSPVLVTLAALFTALSLIVSAGCVPAQQGIDGDLADGWPSFEEPVQFVPEPGTCHTVEMSIGLREDYAPFDCSQWHFLETAHVGSFADDPNDRNYPPDVVQPVRQAAREACEEPVAEFLGGPWQAGRFRLIVVVPSQAAWDGGARWFRCDLGIVERPGDPLVSRMGSAAGAMAIDDHALRLRCFDSAAVGADDVPLVEPLDCDSPHQAEFVGAYVEDRLSFGDVESNPDSVHDRCRSEVARYVGVPDDDDLQYRAGTIYTNPSDADWHDGDRTIRCFVWRADPLLTRSVRGGGTNALPIQYE